ASYNAVPNPNINTGAPPFLLTSTGTVTLGVNSVTQIVPEISSTDRVVGTDLALHSSILIDGLAIHGEAGSILFAPSAAISSDPTKPTLGIDNIALTSGLTLNAGIWQTVGSGSSARNFFVFSGGQIYLDHGALLDVSGFPNVPGPLPQHILTAHFPTSAFAPF